MIRHDWTLKELTELHDLPLTELLYLSAKTHRKYNEPSEVQKCQLISIKTGGCSEDCSYCSQSSKYKTGIDAQPLMTHEEVLSRARKAKEQGATRVCLSSAWRQTRSSSNFNKILGMVRAIKEMGLEVCCTLGMLEESHAQQLKEAGLYAYNHNLDTSRDYYKKIISTRTYDDRLSTLAKVRKANISVCCGGIIGLGENKEDRLELIKTLSSFYPHPESVPINRLIPIAGTPLGEQKEIAVIELARMIAIARIAMPRSMIRLSAGRESMTTSDHALCFLAGANSIFMGKKLLTAPNKNIDADLEIFKELKLKTRDPYQQQSIVKEKKLTQEENAYLDDPINTRKKNDYFRTLPVNHSSKIDLSSNDYLGFSSDPDLQYQINKNFEEYASNNKIKIGASGSRLLTGNSAYIEHVENEVAAFYGAEAGLIYNSGYAANSGLVSCLGNSADALILDTGVHSSMWEGAKLSSASKYQYKNFNLDHLESKLKKARCKHRALFVCTPSIHSITGLKAPIKEICFLLNKYDAHLIVDEAHSNGIYGSHGQGMVYDEKLQNEVFARMCTFSKALGYQGAIVLGSQKLIDYLINFSKPFIYSTAMPPANYVTIKSIYQQLEKAGNRRKHLFELITEKENLLKQSSLKDCPSQTHIQSIKFESAQRAQFLANQFKQIKIDVRSIVFPTVRRRSPCLKLALHSFNTKQEIASFFEHLKVFQPMQAVGRT